MLLLLPILLCIWSTAQAGKCKPVEYIMTKATGTSADFNNGTWSTEYGLDGVNIASLEGALYYTIAEAIDVNSYSGYCKRKNDVQYIQFYKVVVCNPDAALDFFSRNRGKDEYERLYPYSHHGYGPFLTFDNGACHSNRYCDTLHGEHGKPNLGPYVGAKSEAFADRNPTVGSQWYSLPGSCPSQEWTKDAECIEEQPSGACLPGQIPDGEKCTYSYEMYGQVNLDDLVGITSIVNKKTNETFKSAQEYCKAGFVEFERDEKFDFLQGLDFWKAPLDAGKNKERVVELVRYYSMQENNLPLPTASELVRRNPECHETNPDCLQGSRFTCTRNEQMLCETCTSGNCESIVNPEKDIVALSKLPGTPKPPQAPPATRRPVTQKPKTTREPITLKPRTQKPGEGFVASDLVPPPKSASSSTQSMPALMTLMLVLFLTL